MKTTVSSRLSKDQPNQKRELYETVWQDPASKVRHYMLVDRPPEAFIAPDIADETPNRNYNKFLQRTFGLHK